MLSGAEGHLSLGHRGEVLRKSDRATGTMHRERRVPTDKMLEVLDWIDSSVAFLSVHEALVGAHWLRL